ncbi:MAG: helix-turn-helix transcriptional regulator [Clostridia bacterium]|nr:helix-turn-helix transcriptional regulator [Clostridia bacterium]
MFDTMQVAKRIRNARIEKNLTQAAVADALGVSYQAVSNWERGNSMPDIAKLPELCALLGVSFESLVGGASPDAAAVQKAMEGRADHDQRGRVRRAAAPARNRPRRRRAGRAKRRTDRLCHAAFARAVHG